jgi:hypothetical protein
MICGFLFNALGYLLECVKPDPDLGRLPSRGIRRIGGDARRPFWWKLNFYKSAAQLRLT